MAWARSPSSGTTSSSSRARRARARASERRAGNRHARPGRGGGGMHLESTRPKVTCNCTFTGPGVSRHDGWGGKTELEQAVSRRDGRQPVHRADARDVLFVRVSYDRRGRADATRGNPRPCGRPQPCRAPTAHRVWCQTGVPCGRPWREICGSIACATETARSRWMYFHDLEPACATDA